MQVVGAFQLAAHVLDLALVVLSLGLGLLQFGLLLQDLLVFLGEIVAGHSKHLLVLSCARLLDELFQFAGEQFQFGF